MATLVADANTALDFVQLAIRRVAVPDEEAAAARNAEEEEDDEDGPRAAAAAAAAAPASFVHYCLVNVEPDAPATAHGTDLSSGEVAYLRALVREEREREQRFSPFFFHPFLQPSHTHSLSPFSLPQLHAMARDGTGFSGRLTLAAILAAQPARLPGQEEGEEGEGIAEAAAVPLPPRKDRQAILRKLVSAGWLACGSGGGGNAGDGGRPGRHQWRASGEGGGGRGGGGTPAAAATAAAPPSWYAIGPRSFAELMGLLVGETDALEERKAAWGEL